MEYLIFSAFFWSYCCVAVSLISTGYERNFGRGLSCHMQFQNQTSELNIVLYISFILSSSVSLICQLLFSFLFSQGLTPKVLVVGPKLIFSFTLAQYLISRIDTALGGDGNVEGKHSH